MAKYRVTLEVDYVVEAISLSEALTIAYENSEHPLIGGGEGSYCDDTRLIGGSIERENN